MFKLLQINDRNSTLIGITLFRLCEDKTYCLNLKFSFIFYNLFSFLRSRSLPLRVLLLLHCFYTSNSQTESRVNTLLLSWRFTVLIRAESSRERWGEVEDGRVEAAQRRDQWLLGGGEEEGDATHAVPTWRIRARRGSNSPNDSLQS